jgi:uncharacterized repeat protein (TIGR02543 family)
MAFPGTYNLSYYRGDTLEFRAYPKNSSGGVFSLDGYSVSFTIAESRGDTQVIECFAQISDDNTFVLAVIRQGDGSQLDPSKTYVYDLEVRKPGVPYAIVHTLLTGSISVTEQVSYLSQPTDTGNVSYRVFYNDQFATTGSLPEDANSYTLNSFATVLGNGTLARPGHTFSGWSLNSSGTGNTYVAGGSLAIAGNTNLYSKWSANTYSVTFDSNGGTSVEASTYDTGGFVSEPVDPTRDGFVFDGWYSSAELEEQISFPYSPAGFGNIIIYAKWTEATA